MWATVWEPSASSPALQGHVNRLADGRSDLREIERADAKKIRDHRGSYVFALDFTSAAIELFL